MHPKHFGIKTLDLKNAKYEKWIKTKPCLVCGREGVDPHHHWHCRRNDYLCVPLCREHHTEYHKLESDAFENLHNLNLSWEIINLLVEWNAK